MTWFNSLLRPQDLCSFLSRESLYQQQRDRVAALAHDGFALWDRYQAARPYLFAGSLLAAAGSGYLWWKRGLKKGTRLPEANMVYPALTLASLTVAWITRPDAILPPAAPRATAQDGPGFIGWVDSRVEQLSAEDPNFADKVFSRLVTTPGVDSVWAQTPSHARVFITCGRKK
jgi:hypothetical protein